MPNYCIVGYILSTNNPSFEKLNYCECHAIFQDILYGCFPYLKDRNFIFSALTFNSKEQITITIKTFNEYFSKNIYVLQEMKMVYRVTHTEIYWASTLKDITVKLNYLVPIYIHCI